MKIVFASRNAGKLNELNALLSKAALTIIPQSDLGIEAAAETASTFVENALIKARHAANASGLPALADDSGLVVPALAGAPGIYSARFAKEKATAQDNIAKLLLELSGVADEKRHAYFYCVLVYLAHASDPAPLICEGKWSGMILQAPKGTSGFGYDPVFFLPHLRKTAAELPIATKNNISHRGQAFHALLKKLSEKE